jgi:anti-sigma B factor antagonist
MEELETDETSLVIGHDSDSAGDPVIKLSGEVDISNADTLRKAVELLVRANPKRLVFDLGQLTFMDSSGLAAMVFAANNVETIELRRTAPIVRRVIEATGLTEILRMEP